MSLRILPLLRPAQSRRRGLPQLRRTQEGQDA
jgi:hypothetical protein